MSFRTFLRGALVAALPLSLTVAGCAGADADADPAAEPVESSEAAIAACGSAQYAEALGHYKNAVAYSKERLAHGVCEWENGYLWLIADEASRAVMGCGQFRETIRTSPWAAPLRTALAPTLTLRSLTGELAVIKDSSFQNWTGTDAFFGKGLSFWARAEGAYGSALRIDFRASGKATWGQLNYDPASGEITWHEEPATYTIQKINGSESGKRRVTVKRGAWAESFTLGVESGLQYRDAPIFTLTPDSDTLPKILSLVSECDA